MTSSTTSIKTAVSLQRHLFLQVDQIAKELALPRSQVFVLALEAFVQHHHNQALLTQLNQAHEDDPRDREPKLAKARRRSHRRIVEGEW